LNIGIGLGLTFVLGYGVKKLPDIMSKWLAEQIDKALSAGDDIDDDIVLDLCYWAERKIEREFPNGQGGKLKYALVADKFIAMLPITVRPFVSGKNEKIAEVIEANVERLKADLKNRRTTHA
jgi:hypothetical protein